MTCFLLLIKHTFPPQKNLVDSYDKKDRMKTIGRADRADFPELDLENLHVKIDTGAYTSSIHCHHIKEKTIRDKRYIEFALLDPSYMQYPDKVFKTKNFKQKKVKSSFGDIEQRYVVKTKIILFGKEYSIDLSLSERGNMKFPILLGRKFLKNKFIVDPSLEDVSYSLKSLKQ